MGAHEPAGRLPGGIRRRPARPDPHPEGDLAFCKGGKLFLSSLTKRRTSLWDALLTFRSVGSSTGASSREQRR